MPDSATMRILTLTNTYPPHYYGGYELTCRDVMDRFAARGHDVHVLTSDVRVPDVTDTAQPQVTRTLTAYWDWERNAATVPLSPLARLRIEQHNNREFQLVVERVRPDVVSVWHMGALSLSLLTAAECRGLPMVLTVANEWLWTGPLLDGWARLWRHLPAQPRAVGGVATRLPALDGATVNFVSAFTKQQTIDAKVPWDLHDAPVVHPGIEAADFGPPDASELDNDWSWRVLYVGRIDPQKGVETLVRAAASLPERTRLELIGGGDIGYQQRLRTLADELGLGDRMSMTTVRRDQLRQRYVASDVVVFPSEWDEPFGLVPLEAMACGRPVVATGRGGSGEFLQDRVNCVLYRSGAVAELADAIRTVASDVDLRRRLVQAGLATASRYTADRYAENLLRLHEQAIRRPRTPDAAG